MSKTILIVDDFRTIRSIVGSTLRINKFKTFEAGSVDEAEALLRSEDIDLILSDYNMPEMNGYEFLKRIRSSADFKNIPFLFLTSEKDTTKMQMAKKEGLDGWIQKPYNLEQFISTINYCIEKRSA